MKKSAAETRLKNKERYLAQLPSPEKTDLNSNKLSKRNNNLYYSVMGLVSGTLGAGRASAVKLRKNANVYDLRNYGVFSS